MSELPVLVVAGDDSEPVSKARHLVVLLHGHDSTPREIGEIASTLDPGEDSLVVAIEGPVDLAAPLERAWFVDGPTGPDQKSFLHAVHSIRETITAIGNTHGLTVEKTVLVGFSQGAAAAIAVTFGVSDKANIPALAILSGFLTESEGHLWDWERVKDTAVLVQHGSDDEVVPIEFAQDLLALFKQVGGDPEFEEFAMGHERTTASIKSVAKWIDQLS